MNARSWAETCRPLGEGLADVEENPHFDMSVAPLLFDPDLQAAFEAELPPESALVLCPKA